MHWIWIGFGHDDSKHCTTSIIHVKREREEDRGIQKKREVGDRAEDRRAN